MTIRSTCRSRPVGTHPAGFSLIELMIVVAIIGILASIAWPNYQEYIRKTNRTAAKSFLMEVMQRQQQYLLDARSYAATLTDLGMTVPPDVSKNYDILAFTIVASPPSVTVTADAKGDQAVDGDLSISSTGATTGKW